jgi:hypothetical protein
MGLHQVRVKEQLATLLIRDGLLVDAGFQVDDSQSIVDHLDSIRRPSNSGRGIEQRMLDEWEAETRFSVSRIGARRIAQPSWSPGSSRTRLTSEPPDETDLGYCVTGPMGGGRRPRRRPGGTKFLRLLCN